MNSSRHSDFYITFHQKALEIHSISRAISDYLIQDLCVLSANGKENPNVYFSGDIVQQSVSLSEEIRKAQQHSNSDRRYRHARTLRWLTYRLLQNCKRLENSSSDGRVFLKVLKRELKKFKSLQKHWALIL